MAREVSSKSIDGITDLVVVAPIKDGFINAYENITYGSRLKLVAEALNRVRVSAREHERITPFTDVTERILNLLDFRIGILDKDVFSLVEGKDESTQLESRRFLYLTATFEGGWEPYMRLIWKPLGAFLDLLFCNCEGYVTATEHSCEEYLQWVRDNQMDSAIFYAVTGLTTRDERYLSRLERLQREGADDLALAKYAMPYPDVESAATRQAHLLKTIELALEALTVLYKLADYYPPEWMIGTEQAYTAREGHRLIRAAREILRGWDPVASQLEALPAGHTFRILWERASHTYAEPLNWYRTGSNEVRRLDGALQASMATTRPDPQFDAKEVQGGIIKAQGSSAAPIQLGALLLFSIQDSKAAREFIKELRHHYHSGPDSDADDGIYRTIAFTPNGLLRLGLESCTLDRFPKEFRDGMAQRSGLVGDMRENHPRNWILPERNGPKLLGTIPQEVKLPPVELDEVDIVIQLRSSDPNPERLNSDIGALAAKALGGAYLEAVEFMQAGYDPATGLFRDHFGYVDGISQPSPPLPSAESQSAPLERDRVKAGEVLLGYANDRGDSAPGPHDELDGTGKPMNWRAAHRAEANALQLNGSYLVIRKIGEEVSAFEGWLATQSVSIASTLGIGQVEAAALLKAAIMGRDAVGRPLVTLASQDLNDFDYGDDPDAVRCPFSAHIRRANPRRTAEPGPGVPENTWAEFGRKTPRLVRRGMLFGGEGSGPKGLMFMAYNASIAEQYENIQRWLNGGNSTDVMSANNDPLTGIQPKDQAGKSAPNVFRFIATDSSGRQRVIRVPLPPVTPPGTSEPGRHPFTPLHWGLYLLVPSRSAIGKLVELQGSFKPMRDPLELYVGAAWIKRLRRLSAKEAGKEWKRLLEDFVAKDPSEADITPSLWAAIRYYYRGVLNLRYANRDPGPLPPPMGLPAASGLQAAADPEVDEPRSELASDAPEYDWQTPNRETQNVVLCAGRTQVRQVLHDWKNFTNEEQLRRIHKTSGPIFVTQQPDDKYLNNELSALGLEYKSEAIDTNEILGKFDEKWGFESGYAAGKAVLAEAIRGASQLGRSAFKLELRRQFLFPALGLTYKTWYGLPDEDSIALGGWSWKRIVEEISAADPEDVSRTQALCPGDFLSPSRAAFYPRPTESIEAYGRQHGPAILKAGQKFVAKHRASGGPPMGPISQEMFRLISDDDVLARNLIGTMVGAIPPMEANLRGVIAEWLIEKTLWRHQAALDRALEGKDPGQAPDLAMRALVGPVSQAMCKRPAPDLLFRTATSDALIRFKGSSSADEGTSGVRVRKGDLVVVSQVSAAHRSLMDSDTPDGDVSYVFGGNRSDADQVDSTDPSVPVHACPAQKMAMGAMMGILAALLEVGRVQALPASLIVKISDWRHPPT